MTDETESAPAYELAFAEAGRDLDAQERSVSELRSRAGVLIAAAAVSTSFFGARIVTPGSLDAWAWIALGAFVVVAVCVLAVLWPQTDWQFSADARSIIAEYVEPDRLPIEAIHRDLALHRGAAYHSNADQLRLLFLVFRIGLAALVVETVSWVVALVERV